MNSKERMAAAMALQEPDRVPVMCQLPLGHYFLNCGFTAHEIWFDSDAFATALVMLQRRYRFDGILVNVPGRPADLLAHRARRPQCRWRGADLAQRRGHVRPLGRQSVPPRRPRRARRPADFRRSIPTTSTCWTTCPVTGGVYHVPYLAGKSERGHSTRSPRTSCARSIWSVLRQAMTLRFTARSFRRSRTFSSCSATSRRCCIC